MDKQASLWFVVVMGVTLAFLLVWFPVLMASHPYITLVSVFSAALFISRSWNWKTPLVNAAGKSWKFFTALAIAMTVAVITHAILALIFHTSLVAVGGFKGFWLGLTQPGLVGKTVQKELLVLFITFGITWFWLYAIKDRPRAIKAAIVFAVLVLALSSVNTGWMLSLDQGQYRMYITSIKLETDAKVAAKGSEAVKQAAKTNALKVNRPDTLTIPRYSELSSGFCFYQMAAKEALDLNNPEKPEVGSQWLTNYNTQLQIQVGSSMMTCVELIKRDDKKTVRYVTQDFLDELVQRQKVVESKPAQLASVETGTSEVASRRVALPTVQPSETIREKIVPAAKNARALEAEVTVGTDWKVSDPPLIPMANDLVVWGPFEDRKDIQKLQSIVGWNEKDALTPSVFGSDGSYIGKSGIFANSHSEPLRFRLINGRSGLKFSIRLEPNAYKGE